MAEFCWAKFNNASSTTRAHLAPLLLLLNLSDFTANSKY